MGVSGWTSVPERETVSAVQQQKLGLSSFPPPHPPTPATRALWFGGKSLLCPLTASLPFSWFWFALFPPKSVL